MIVVREVVSKGLDERNKIKIAVKQPLSKVTISKNVDKELFDLIKDELNVKEVVVGKDSAELVVEFDTTLTPQLKQEGMARELIRKLNDLRKKSGLTIDDRISVSIFSESELVKTTINNFGEEIKNSVQADKITLEENGGEEINLKEQIVKLAITK